MAVASPIHISIALQYHVISLSNHTNSQHRASAVINIILQQARSFGFGLLRCCRLLHQLGCTSEASGLARRVEGILCRLSLRCDSGSDANCG